jgi:hypothetical protein
MSTNRHHHVCPACGQRFSCEIRHREWERVFAKVPLPSSLIRRLCIYRSEHRRNGTLVQRLLTIRGRVRSHHTLVAARLLDELIEEVDH